MLDLEPFHIAVLLGMCIVGFVLICLFVCMTITDCITSGQDDHFTVAARAGLEQKWNADEDDYIWVKPRA